MSEQTFNNYNSTLAAPYVAGSLSATVASATGLPATGTFTLSVFDAISKALIVVLRVSARVGAVLTVAAEGTDTNAASGSTVRGGMLSAAALAQIETDTIAASVTAALSTPQSANKVLAGPTSGGSAVTTFRALVAADLPNTAVTPGSYTSTSLTVDQQGRITAAANGGGSGGGIVNGYGPLASRPVSGTTVGDMYVASDGTFDVYRWNGTSWDAFVAGILCNNPIASVFPTSVKTPGVTVANYAMSNGVLVYSPWTAGGDNLAAQVLVYPATPFSRRLRFRLNTSEAGNLAAGGIVIYDTVTDKALLYAYTVRSADFSVVVYSYNTVTAPGIAFYQTQQNNTSSFRGGLLDIRFTDDGTNRIIEVCLDGQNFVTVMKELNTTFLTPNRIGFGMETLATVNNSDVLSIYDWS